MNLEIITSLAKVILGFATAPKESLPVLIVEDDVDAAELISSHVARCGYKWVIQTHPAAAMLELQRNRYSAMLLDVSFPGSASGLDFERKVHRRWPKLKVIFLTGVRVTFETYPKQTEPLPPAKCITLICKGSSTDSMYEAIADALQTNGNHQPDSRKLFISAFVLCLLSAVCGYLLPQLSTLVTKLIK